MPLYKTIKSTQHTQIIVWKIEESLDELYQGISLTQNSINRISNMRSEIHQKGYLSVRQLLKVLGYQDVDLFYTDDGKPHLKDGKHISITHSFIFSGIIISDYPVGIDIEMNREKIIKIASKFVADECNFFEKDQLVEQLTVVWGAKESLFKMHPDGGLLFKHHLPIEPFKLSDRQTRGWIKKDKFFEVYSIYFEPLENFTLVYAV
ncbi:MAG: 4'-phosphopantetheinyl transferase superfamily protein [Flavobacteriaceae bacterium]|jgi:phosphopantetheinyl transferase|nr:4'-phosphopantetheinyl transferase superfamily protein [Flavobacteriaceae bacterium]